MFESSGEPEVDFRTRNRLKLVLFFFLFLFLAIFARLFYIQILNSSKYRKLAEVQHLKKVESKAKRGNIFDRNGNLLASTITSRSFAIDPFIVSKDSNATKEFFAFGKLLGFTENKLLQILNSEKRFVWIKRNLIEYSPTLDTFDFPGLIKLTEPKRIYLYGASTLHLLGLVNLDNKGIGGLELSFDSILSGKDGYVYFLKDARGRLLPSLELPSKPAVDGSDLKLTIDIDFQNIASYFLEQGINETKANGGCVVAMNPKNGEILAFVSYPNFDPNENTQLDNDRLFSYPVNFGFEPGSTIKPFIAAIALSRKLINEHTLFNGYNGKFSYGDVLITDEHPFSTVNLRDALVYSSNIAFAQIASLIPNELLENDLKNFGFGQKTGIPIPGELKGYVKRTDSLTLTQQMFLGFGYGILTTPIQLLVAYTSIANNGIIVKPKLLANDTTGDTKNEILDKEVVQILNKYLIGVVNEGTAVSTKLEGFEIAGKTGTSQKYQQGAYSKSSYVNTFVGYFPADNPKVIMLVLLDEPQTSIYAGSTVVPIFRKIVLALLNSKLTKYIYD